jgi:hypothetical protein
MTKRGRDDEKGGGMTGKYTTFAGCKVKIRTSIVNS